MVYYGGGLDEEKTEQLDDLLSEMTAGERHLLWLWLDSQDDLASVQQSLRECRDQDKADRDQAKRDALRMDAGK